MDITLIQEPTSFLYNRKNKKTILSGTAITELIDCSMVLLHKADLRPLYVFNDSNQEKICLAPQQKMEKPDLILFSDTEIGKQSARVIQEQLFRGGCSTRILPTNFSVPEDNFENFKNRAIIRAESLEKRGFKHLVIVAPTEILDKISCCMTGKVLSGQHNIPIYSFSDGKEISDPNLSRGLSITRDILDNFLIRVIRKQENPNFVKYKNSCPPLEVYQIEKKLHLRG